jgi:hypothetical protein
MKIKNLTVSVLCLAILALSGCGKKSSDNTPPPVVTQPTSTTAITGLATKGPIAGATVTVLAIRSDVTDTANPLGQAQTDAKGNYTVQTFGYKGPVVVEVTGGSYKDEISGAQVTLKTPFRAMLSSLGTGTTPIVVTPLTEFAAKKAEGAPVLTGDVIDAANRYIADRFSLTNITTSFPNASSTDPNQTGYAAALGAISQLVIDSMRPGDIAPNQPMDDALATVMTTFGDELRQTGVFSSSTISAINLATTLFSSGSGTTTPPSIIPPPPTPAGGVVKFGTAGIPNPPDTLRGIIFTVTLPAGVTVALPLGSNDAAGTSVLLSPTPVPKTRTLAALVTQASGTIPGKIDVQVQDGKGIALGQFLTMNFIMDTTLPFSSFPKPADLLISGITIQGLKLVALTGVDVAPISLVPTP